MKKLAILTILILFPCFWMQAQTDSIPVAERISSMELSKSDLISKGRRLLLKDLNTGNIQGVKEIVEYLAMDVEDEDHLALWGTERLMLYYWIGDYTNVLHWSIVLNSDTAKGKYPSVTPSDDLVGKKVAEMIELEYNSIVNDFQSLKFSKDTELFLSLFLNRLIIVYNPAFVSIDKINEYSNDFVRNYPDSPLSKVVKEAISYRFKPGDWQLGMTLSGGLNFTSGNITDYIDFSKGFFNMSLDAYYKRLYFGINISSISGKVSRDIDIKKKNRTWWAGEDIPITMIAPTIGFSALDYKRLKLLPFAGVSLNFSAPSQYAIDENPDLEGLSLGTSVTPLLGLSADICLTNMNKIKPNNPYNLAGVAFYLGLKAMYMPSIITNQESRMTGSTYMLGLSFKMNFFQLKRVY